MLRRRGSSVRCSPHRFIFQSLQGWVGRWGDPSALLRIGALAWLRWLDCQRERVDGKARVSLLVFFWRSFMARFRRVRGTKSAKLSFNLADFVMAEMVAGRISSHDMLIRGVGQALERALRLPSIAGLAGDAGLFYEGFDAI